MNTSVSSGNSLALTGSNHQITQNTQQRNITKKIIGALSLIAIASNSYSKGSVKTDVNNLRSAFPQSRYLESISSGSHRALIGFSGGGSAGAGAASGSSAGVRGDAPQNGDGAQIPEATFNATLKNTQTGETQSVSFDVAGFNRCFRRDQYRSIAISLNNETGNSLEQLKTNQTLFAIKDGEEKVWQLSDYSLVSTQDVDNFVGIRDSKRSEQTIDRGRLFGIGGADGLPRHRYAVSENTPSGIVDAIKSAISHSPQIQDAENSCGARQKTIISVSCVVGLPLVAFGAYKFFKDF